jgi:hypothetical protein
MNAKKSFWSTLPGILTAVASLIVAITGLLTVIPHRSNQNNRDCPQIGGDYRRTSNDSDIGTTFQIKQNDCDVSGFGNTGSHEHHLTGHWQAAEKRFKCETVRKNLKTGKATILYGYLYFPAEGQMRSVVFGTDGRDDEPVNFTEELDFVKQ